MSVPDLERLIESVTSWVKNKSAQLNSDDIEVNPQTDLLSSGLLDSLAFIDLIAYIEEGTGAQIDLMEIDLEEFTTIEGLCQFSLGDNSVE